MQPVMDYGTGYCEFECTSCLNVCPVGAILPLGLKEKQRTQIGKVQFIKDRCVIFSQGTACGACAEVCPTGAVWMVPYLPQLTQPKTDNDICVGCGNCEYACPVEGGKAIFVRGNEVHVEREVREKGTDGPEVAEPEEFPF
jgi:ferredoxin